MFFFSFLSYFLFILLFSSFFLSTFHIWLSTVFVDMNLTLLFFTTIPRFFPQSFNAFSIGTTHNVYLVWILFLFSGRDNIGEVSISQPSRGTINE